MTGLSFLINWRGLTHAAHVLNTVLSQVAATRHSMRA
jgi:hypothetical protein